MFICSVRGNTLKLAGIIISAVIALTVLIIALPQNEAVAAGSIFNGSDSTRYDRIKTEADRKDFLSQFGWQTADGCIDEIEMKIPSDFDKIMKSYNEIQKSQGMDLTKYKGKTVQRYTYKIENYPDYSGTVYANIIIYDDRVIGGDICSSDISGFIHGFEAKTKG